MTLFEREGAENAGYRLAPAAPVRKNAQGSDHRYSRAGPAFPARVVLTAYSVLSPATNSSCHRRRRIDGSSRPVGLMSLRRLGTSNGCQDHTASPSAQRRSSCASANRSRPGRPAMSLRADAAASTASRTTFVTTRTPLSSGGMAESIKLFLPNREAVYFLLEGWTGNCDDSPSGKSVGPARRVRCG
jgi:hypothetical protein